MMPIQQDTKVAALLDEREDLVEVFRRRGFAALANPWLRKTVARNVTIAEGCRRHGVDLESFLDELRREAAGEGGGVGSGTVVPAGGGDGSGSSPSVSGRRITATWTTGEVSRRFPAALEVFQERFGGACFTCPSFGLEDIRTACMMHNADEDEFVAELNRVAGLDTEPSENPEGEQPS